MARKPKPTPYYGPAYSAKTDKRSPKPVNYDDFDINRYKSPTPTYRKPYDPQLPSTYRPRPPRLRYSPKRAQRS